MLLSQGIRLKEHQSEVFHDPHRFVVLVSGRRWAKTTTLLLKMEARAFQKRGLYGYFAPTYGQAKLIAWDILKSISPRHYILSMSETELSITYKNLSKIRLFGLDKAVHLLGMKLAGAIIDEYDQVKKDVYESIIRPSLSDSMGFCWFAGSPDRYRRRLKELSDSVKINKYPDWSAYHFKSIDGGYIPVEEIENARRELDERTFREQYEGTYEDVTGQVYYAFSTDENIKTDLTYNPALPLRICWDFNVNPFCVCFAQSVQKIDDFRNTYTDVHVFDEMAIPNSNTPEMCRMIIDKFGTHKAGFYIYGDATAKARNTASSLSDYQIILEYFKNFQNVNIRFKDGNPAIKDRINSVNSKLKACDGKRHLFLHPKCKVLTRDFLSVCLKEGTNVIDESDLELTHMSSALGYYLDYEFPVIKTFVRA